MTPDPLLSLLDEERTNAIHRGRTRAQWLRIQAQSEATLAGTLLDLAENRAPATIRTRAGNTHSGVIGTVGRDFLAMVTRADTHIYCALDAVTTVRSRSTGRHGPSSGDRKGAVDLLLREFLAAAAEDRPWATLTLDSGEQVSGRLHAVGLDVVTMLVEDDESSTCYVSSPEIAEALVRSVSR